MFKLTVVFAALSLLVGCSGAPGNTTNVYYSAPADDAGAPLSEPAADAGVVADSSPDTDAGDPAAELAACKARACKVGTCGVLPSTTTCDGEVVDCGGCPEVVDGNLANDICGDNGAVNRCGNKCFGNSMIALDACTAQAGQIGFTAQFATGPDCQGSPWNHPGGGEATFRVAGRTGCKYTTGGEVAYACCP